MAFQITDKIIKVVVHDVETFGNRYELSLDNACAAILADDYKTSYQNLKAVYCKRFEGFTTDVKKQAGSGVPRKSYQNFDKTVKQLQGKFPDRPKKERAKKDKDIEAMLETLFTVAAAQGETEKLLILMKDKLHGL